jgi:hypothetical protein
MSAFRGCRPPGVSRANTFHPYPVVHVLDVSRLHRDDRAITPAPRQVVRDSILAAKPRPAVSAVSNAAYVSCSRVGYALRKEIGVPLAERVVDAGLDVRSGGLRVPIPCGRSQQVRAHVAPVDGGGVVCDDPRCRTMRRR